MRNLIGKLVVQRKEIMQIFMTMAMAGVITIFFVPNIAAAAFDPDAAGNTMLNFFKLILIVAAAVSVVYLVMKSAIVPAVVVVVAAAFFYVLLSPTMLTSLGQGLATWLGIN